MKGEFFFAAGLLIGILTGCCSTAIFQKHHKQIYYKRISHEKQYLDMMHQWFILKENGLPLSDILKKYDVSNVAVYGMGIIGRHVIRELEGSGIIVSYGIDKKNMDSYKDIAVFTPEGQLEKVDAVINTVVWSHDEIKRLLGGMMDVPVFSLEELVFDRYGLN